MGKETEDLRQRVRPGGSLLLCRTWEGIRVGELSSLSDSEMFPGTPNTDSRKHLSGCSENASPMLRLTFVLVREKWQKQGWKMPRHGGYEPLKRGDIFAPYSPT